MFRNVIFTLALISVVKCNIIKDVGKKIEKAMVDSKYSDVPDWFDWRDYKMVTPVKNQLHCAACWAFSIVAAVESHRLIHLNSSGTLSEQFLIDCVNPSYGCQKAPILKTLGYIVGDIGGILFEKLYKPYQDQVTTCTWRYNREATVPLTKPLPIPVVGFRRVNGERNMQKSLFENGPLIVAINSVSMVKYNGGIDDPTVESCPPADLDHTVLVVGYNIYVDENRSVRYWIIKNSWGSEWGDNGFYYIVRGKNACGIGLDVSFPYVD